MKGLGNLIKNELIKTGKAVYFKVFTSLILILAIALPTVIFIYDKIVEKNNSVRWEIEYYDMTDDKVEKAFYSCYKEANEFFEQNSISKDDWRYEDYYEDYASYFCARVKAFDMLAKGEATFSEVQMYFYNAIEQSISEDLIKEFTTDVSSITGTNVSDSENSDGESYDEYIGSSYEGLSKEQYAAIRDAAQKDKDKIAKYIKSATVVDKYNSLVKYYQNEVKNAKSVLDEAQKNYNKTKSIEHKKEVADAQAAYDSKSLMLWGYEELLKGKYESDDWHYKEIKTDLSNASSALTQNVKYDEDVYKEFLSDQYRSYKQYCLGIEPSLRAANKTIAAVKYSFEKNIPINEESDDSAAYCVTSEIKFINILICLFMIVMAGTTLSNEFISGSVRLLLVRPRSRNKILLSKILSVFIYGAGLMLVSLVIVSAINLGIRPEKDLFEKIVMAHFSGTAYAAYPILIALFKGILSIFSVNLMVSFSFLLSVLFTKGGVLAVALSNIIQVACVSLPSVFDELNYVMLGFIEYTPMPYLDLGSYLTNPIDDGALMGGYYSAGIQSVFNPVIGAVIIAVLSIVMYALSFVIFKRKQIKS